MVIWDIRERDLDATQWSKQEISFKVNGDI